MNGYQDVVGLMGLAVAVYFLPLIIAVLRSNPYSGVVAALNLLLGWTVLGWVSALLWAILSRQGACDPRVRQRLNSSCKQPPQAS